jgi:hypothetical protein
MTAKRMNSIEAVLCMARHTRGRGFDRRDCGKLFALPQAQAEAEAERGGGGCAWQTARREGGTRERRIRLETTRTLGLATAGLLSGMDAGLSPA